MNWIGSRWWKFDFHNHTPASDDYGKVNRPGFPGECFICELRLPDHRF
ncbi:taurine dioxygenase [Escherichia coli]|nr:taurine dioxygenase [Escherichia coli]